MAWNGPKLRRDRRAYNPDQRLSRDEAIARGVHVFWTGIPCPAGHVAHRYVSNSFCVECKKERQSIRQSKKVVEKHREDCSAVGVDMEKRRCVEALQEARRLAKDLEDEL